MKLVGGFQKQTSSFVNMPGLLQCKCLVDKPVLHVMHGELMALFIVPILQKGTGYMPASIQQKFVSSIKDFLLQHFFDYELFNKWQNAKEQNRVKDKNYQPDKSLQLTSLIQSCNHSTVLMRPTLYFFFTDTNQCISTSPHRRVRKMPMQLRKHLNKTLSSIIRTMKNKAAS